MREFMEFDFTVRKIILCCLVKAGSGDAVHKNRPSHGLAMNCGGEKNYFFDNGKMLTVGKNDIIYLPKGSNYVVKTDHIGDCYAINFELSDEIFSEPFVFHIKDSARFLEHYKNAEKTWKSKKAGYHLKCKSELYGILYKMQSEHQVGYISKSKREIIRPAVDYIHENYSLEGLSIDALSKMCGITPEYFRSIFKSAFGTSPIKYINSLKIARAEELLGSNMYSVTEAAIMSGYSDISHFSREFKKAYGVSPIEYKRASRK